MKTRRKNRMDKVDVLSVVVVVLFGIVYIYGGTEKFLISLGLSSLTYVIGRYSERITYQIKKLSLNNPEKRKK